MKTEHHGIGLMSGTSLDGVDLAYCHFEEEDGRWISQIVQAETIPYPPDWKERLKGSIHLSGRDLSLLDQELGSYFGHCVRTFVSRRDIHPQWVASHGHTVFHQPEHRLTLQIGHGAALAAACGLKVICQFRNTDIALGGQGAPLVPIGDEKLFASYSHCLNLGGIANISFQHQEQRLAFDICPCNMVINDLAQSCGHDYDANGRLGSQGQVDSRLLDALNQLDFYQLFGPKSLGTEWVQQYFSPLLASSRLSTEDKIRTVYEHIAEQIAAIVRRSTCTPHSRLLATGGGSNNRFLLSRISAHIPCPLHVPSPHLVDFKEALIFAFLGALRIREENNALSSVTGALRDSCGGAIFLS